MSSESNHPSSEQRSGSPIGRLLPQPRPARQKGAADLPSDPKRPASPDFAGEQAVQLIAECLRKIALQQSQTASDDRPREGARTCRMRPEREPVLVPLESVRRIKSWEAEAAIERDHGGIFAAAGILGCLALMIAGIYINVLANDAGAAVAATESSNRSGSVVSEMAGNASLDPGESIAEVVRAFCATSEIEEKSRFVQSGAELVPVMRAYYAKRTPELQVSHIGNRYGVANVGGRQLFMGDGFYVNGKSFTYVVERRNGEYLLDWKALVGYCETDWIDFLEQQPDTPRTFRVLASSSDYYNFDYADEDAELCLKLYDRENRRTCYGYVWRNSQAGMRLTSHFSKLEALGIEESKVTVSLAFEPGKNQRGDQLRICDFHHAQWIDDEMKETKI